MRRISTATRVVSKFGVGKDGFTNGNAVGGIPATDCEDVWFDHVQEEIAGVIEAAGIALDVANRAQLLAALRAAGVFQTPATGDNSTKVATTAFVVATALGVAQTWQDVKASRAAGTTYTNSTGKPIFVAVSSAMVNANDALKLTVNGIAIVGSSAATNGPATSVSAIVPNGGTYALTSANSAAAGVGVIATWTELR